MESANMISFSVFHSSCTIHTYIRVYVCSYTQSMYAFSLTCAITGCMEYCIFPTSLFARTLLKKEFDNAINLKYRRS